MVYVTIHLQHNLSTEIYCKSEYKYNAADDNNNNYYYHYNDDKDHDDNWWKLQWYYLLLLYGYDTFDDDKCEKINRWEVVV